MTAWQKFYLALKLIELTKNFSQAQVRGQIISHIRIMHKLLFELLIRIMATIGKFTVTSNKFNTYSMCT